ncbi:MAG TPA: hypothetical protein VGJ32_07550 [Solirubrobacteraceae bacterium]
MRTVGVVVVGLAVLALGGAPGVAGAKEISQVLACGAGGCRDVTARVPHDESMMEDGFVESPPSHRSAFIRLRFAAGDGTHRNVGRWYADYLPRRGLLRTVDEVNGVERWTRLAGKARHVFRRAVRGIRPLPASAMRRPAPASTHVTLSGEGALPPEVVEVPVAARDEGGGLDARPVVAAGLGLVGAVGLVVRRRRRRS